MKIGILTLPLHTNYGGILQAYALQTILEREGHEVVVFDTDKHLRLPLWRMPITLPLRFLRKLRGKERAILKEQLHNREYPIISRNIQPFVDAHIHRRIVGDFGTLQSEDYDALIVGSDQVWRPGFFRLRYRCLADAYLCFARHWSVKRIAYAASFGTDAWEYSPRETAVCKQYAKKFDLITVREASAVELCKVHFDVEAHHVLDPTMFLGADDYLKLLGEETKKNAEQGTRHEAQSLLTHYILDDTPAKTEFINRLARTKNLQLLKVNSRVEDESAPLSERIQPSVEHWLRGFRDAAFVVTDSFHACVFSILFKKQFFVCINEGRGAARFYSLLSLFGLENRIVTDFSTLGEFTPIDYSAVDSRLSEWRKKSLDLLKAALLCSDSKKS